MRISTSSPAEYTITVSKLGQLHLFKVDDFTQSFTQSQCSSCRIFLSFFFVEESSLLFLQIILQGRSRWLVRLQYFFCVVSSKRLPTFACLIFAPLTTWSLKRAQSMTFASSVASSPCKITPSSSLVKCEAERWL